MTTEAQNQIAQKLEYATSKEIRQIAEYAIDHIDDRSELAELRDYIDLAIFCCAKPRNAKLMKASI